MVVSPAAVNIVDLLTRDQQYFSTLLDAGKVAGLTDQLTGAFTSSGASQSGWARTARVMAAC